jgi:DNA-binding Lrp family transcriptional regulator
MTTGQEALHRDDEDEPDAVHLDRIDLEILRLLAGDARLSQRRIAHEIGTSPPTVADRVARLERSGVIRGYRVEIDRSLLGFPLVAYLGVVAIQGPDQADVVTALRALPEVEEVDVVTGPMDFLVRLRVRSHKHLRDVLFERIWTISGIDRTQTFISLGQMEAKSFNVDLVTTMLGEERD